MRKLDLNPFLRHGKAGVSLIELMIALSILSVVFISAARFFLSVGKGAVTSKFQTLANNLTQEKIRELKTVSYPRVHVTTVSLAIPDLPVSSKNQYDPVVYGVEEIVEGGHPFFRYTFVEKVRKMPGTEDFESVAWTSVDAGVKRVTQTVTWKEGGHTKMTQAIALLGDPNMMIANLKIVGRVLTPLGIPIENALVQVKENTPWQSYTDAMGQYTLTVEAGDYVIKSLKAGFFTSEKSVSVTPITSPLTLDFSMISRGGAKLSGTVWINDRPVISHVVGDVDDAGFSQEWVEIFNPTTWTWLAGDLGLKIQRRTDLSSSEIFLSRVTASIPPGHFYLMANRGVVNVFSTGVSADALWENATGGPNDSNPHFPYFDPPSGQLNIIPVDSDGGGEGSASLELYEISTGRVLDRLGWQGAGGLPPPFYESHPLSQTIGLQTNESFQRFSSTSGYSFTTGPAYDSDDNDTDWESVSPVATPPRNGTAGPLSVHSGRPAMGAYVYCNDGISSPERAMGMGTPSRAGFELPSVGTGTWHFLVSSGSRVLNEDVTVALGVDQIHNIVLSSSTEKGYVGGQVFDAFGHPIVGPLFVSGGETNCPIGAAGEYFLELDPGIQMITANPKGAFFNPDYAEVIANVLSRLGEMSPTQNFGLPAGTRVQGFVTPDGINPLPNMLVESKSFGAILGAETSVTTQADGRFEFLLSTGVYSFTVVPGEGESVVPPTVWSVLDGTDIFVGTFTVFSGFGYLVGSVREGGEPISSGVTVIVTTSTLALPPPITPALRSGSVDYFMGLSDPRGNFKIRARQGPTYNVYGWYRGTKKEITTGVLAGGTTSGVDLQW